MILVACVPWRRGARGGVLPCTAMRPRLRGDQKHFKRNITQGGTDRVVSATKYQGTQLRGHAPPHPHASSPRHHPTESASNPTAVVQQCLTGRTAFGHADNAFLPAFLPICKQASAEVLARCQRLGLDPSALGGLHAFDCCHSRRRRGATSCWRCNGSVLRSYRESVAGETSVLEAVGWRCGGGRRRSRPR